MKVAKIIIMKKIILLFAILFYTNCKAQITVNINTYNEGSNSDKYFKDLDNNYSLFVGTWENTTGNITFRLIIWKESRMKLLNETNSFMDTLLGKYLIIENAGLPNERILFNSIKYFPQSNYTTSWVLLGKATSSSNAYGFFSDTNANNGTNVIDGAFDLKILNTAQAQWLLKADRQLLSGEIYKVPTNAILTKIN